MKQLLTLYIFIFSVILTFAHDFRNLGSKEGMNDLVVNSIFKDSQGYLWFGTSRSVVRFDGTHFKTFTISGTTEKEKEVNTILEAPNGKILVGTNAGLWEINDNSVDRIQAEAINDRVTRLIADSLYVYVATENGLHMLDKDKKRSTIIGQDAMSDSNKILDISLGDGKLWAATRGGVYVSDLPGMRNSRRISIPEGISPTARFGRILWQDGKLYLGSSSVGVVELDPKNSSARSILGDAHVLSLSGNGKNLVYVATNGKGVYFYDSDSEKVISHFKHDNKNGGDLGSNSVYSLLVDKDGLTWAGIFQMGVDYSVYKKSLFSPFYRLPDVDTRHASIRSIFVNGSQMLIGTREGMYFADDARHIYKEFGSGEMRSPLVFSIYHHEGKYYIGTFHGGMLIFDPETLILSDFNTSVSDPFLSGDVFSITTDKKGVLWAATSNGLFGFKDGKTLYQFNHSSSILPEGNIYKIYFDSLDRGWIATEKAIYLMDASDRSIISDKFPKGFCNQIVARSVYEDSAHSIYILPDKGKLFKTNLAMTDFGEVDCPQLNGLSLQGIIEDDSGWLWITTNNGLFRFDKSNHCIRYSSSDGLASEIFINCPPIKDENGTLWFGSAKGLYTTDVQKVEDVMKRNYPLKVTGIVSDGAVFSTEDGVVVPSLKDKLVIEFSDFSYALPENMAFEYMLEGKDNDWQTVNGQTSATYYGLSNGKYTFRLRKPGNPDSEIEYRFTIGSPISWTVIMVVICILAIAVFLMVAVRRRRKIAEPLKPETAPNTESLQMAATEAHVMHIDKSQEDEIKPEMETEAPVKVKAEEKEKYRTYNVSDKECDDIRRQLDKYMREKKPFVNPDLSATDLASEIGISSHKLSYILNKRFEISFYDYVNEYRVEEFQERVDNGDGSRYTIESLYQMCGFSSKSVFFRVFKKSTGTTPKKYITKNS